MAETGHTDIEEQTVENFHGCYLLRSNSENKWFRGRTYIGYTVDPNRRHRQHNRGRKFGGACRTNSRGPWQVILIVYGFMSNISALQFEWAWQHPDESRRLRHVAKKKSKENALAYRLRILAEMLSVDPWKLMPLTVQWLSSEYEVEFPLDLRPAAHVSVLSGAVRTKKVSAPDMSELTILSSTIDLEADVVGEQEVQSRVCQICFGLIEKGQRITCLLTTCAKTFHMTCLAKEFLSGQSALIPLQGACPACKVVVLWADLIRFKRGHYRNGLVELQEAVHVLSEDVPDNAGDE